MDHPVDVCIASVWFHPRPGGPSERFRRYAPALQRRGIQVRFVTPWRSPEEPKIEQGDQFVVERIELPLSDMDGTQSLLPAVLQHFARTASWPDVLQTFSSSKRDVIQLWRARWHGMAALHVSTMMRPAMQQTSLRDRLYVLWQLLPYHAIVTSTSIMTSQLAGYGVGSKRLRTIPNGVDRLRFHPVASPAARAKLRRKLNLAADDEVILFVGLVNPRKSVHTLIEAWHTIAAQRPKAKLVVVGAYREQHPVSPSEQRQIDTYCDRIAHLVKHSPAPERVIFTERVINVEEYLRIADVFVFPSKLEGMPNVVPEAMASGVACILTPFIGLPDEFGQPGHEYLLVNRTSEALAKAVLRVLTDDSERRHLAACALDWAVSRMDVQCSLDQYASLYRQLTYVRT